LCAAMLLARDGHRVTVLERDPAEPPEPDAAWAGWDRRGCAQFRLPHYMLPRFRQLLERELPDVATALAEAGGLRYDVLARLPEVLAAVGATWVVGEREPCGFGYYGRRFRSPGGLPAQRGSFTKNYDSVSLLTLPADAGTWSVTITASSHDTQLRALRDPDR